MEKIVVKNGRRKRYIGFKIIQPPEKFFEKKDIINIIRNQCSKLYNKDCREMGVYLIRFQRDQGIVRCKHTEKENTINLLKSIKKISDIDVKVETLGTSGTIKSLVKKHMTS